MHTHVYAQVHACTVIDGGYTLVRVLIFRQKSSQQNKCVQTFRFFPQGSHPNHSLTQLQRQSVICKDNSYKGSLRSARTTSTRTVCDLQGQQIQRQSVLQGRWRLIRQSRSWYYFISDGSPHNHRMVATVFFVWCLLPILRRKMVWPVYGNNTYKSSAMQPHFGWTAWDVLCLPIVKWRIIRLKVTVGLNSPWFHQTLAEGGKNLPELSPVQGQSFFCGCELGKKCTANRKLQDKKPAHWLDTCLVKSEQHQGVVKVGINFFLTLRY